MRGRRHKLQVSTFPFLAVLLCAMGSLILVLLVMDRKAHKAAQARAQREAARLVEESAQKESARHAEHERLRQQARKAWEQKRDALHDKWTREQIELQLQMRKVREELQQIAARLHYEQDTTIQLRRKVQKERSRLQAEEQLLRTLRSNAKQIENQSKESSQALRRMTLDLLQMEQVLKDLKASRQREQKTFSVVPYHGRRGENRRPLYIECTADAVIFHPERKAMPLAALLPGSSDSSCAVRAEVERRVALQRQKLANLPTNVNKTPYLLLLLRPSGVSTYILLQRALRGLDLDFGYEFIDEDWVLDFPADDELPSTQPWMIAAKTPARPVPPPSVAASPPPPTNTRPPTGAPMSNSTAAFASNLRGFRASEMGTTSGSLGEEREPPKTSVMQGRYASGTNNNVSTQGGYASGTNNNVSTQGGYASGTNNNVGTQGGYTSGTNNNVGTQGGYASGANNNVGVPGYPAEIGNQGNTTPGEMSTGLIRGNRRGHPSAMPPAFPSNDGGSTFPGAGSASGEGYTSGEGYRGIGGLFRLYGSNSGTGPGSGFPGDGSSGGPGGDSLGLGPPRALASGSGEQPLGGSAETSAIAGTDATEKGLSGNGGVGGGATGSGIPGAAPGRGRFGDETSVIARGNNSDTPVQTFVGGENFPGRGGTGIPAREPFQPNGGTGQPDVGVNQQAGILSQATNGAGSSVGGGSASADVGHSPNAMGSGASVGGGSASADVGRSPNARGGGASVGGGSASADVGRSPNARGTSGSSEAVIFVDPLTGQPTTPPPPAPPSDRDVAEERPAENRDSNRSGPRIRVVPVNSATGASGGEAGDDESATMNRLPPTPSFAPPPRRLAAPRPAWVHGGRDWIIYVECRASDVVLYPSQRTFSLAQAISAPANNPLLKAIQQMIDRRQSSRRPGEPPYHPQICLLVRPDHIRTFLTVYPALEALPVPKTRRNLDADDDVISIVTGAVP